MQDVAAISDADSMSGVVAALVIAHTVEFFRKECRRSYLFFVAPLNAYDLRHFFSTIGVCREPW